MQKKLSEFYKTEWLRPGKSRLIDTAIVELVILLMNKNGRKGADKPHKFDEKWATFVEIAEKEFPNISPYNLTALHLGATNTFRKENFYVCNLMVRLIPDSAEAHCFLGHAYRSKGRLREAIDCFEKARELAIQTAETIPFSNPYWADAEDYLIHKRKYEYSLGAY